MKNPLDYWDQNVITSEVEVVRAIRVSQYRVSCPWCQHHWLVIVDRTTQEIRGHMLCSHCGEFFGWRIHPPTAASVTRRARATPKPHPLMRN